MLETTFLLLTLMSLVQTLSHFCRKLCITLLNCPGSQIVSPRKGQPQSCALSQAVSSQRGGGHGQTHGAQQQQKLHMLSLHWKHSWFKWTNPLAFTHRNLVDAHS